MIDDNGNKLYSATSKNHFHLWYKQTFAQQDKLTMTIEQHQTKRKKVSK